jgi:hypothetical protein
VRYMVIETYTSGPGPVYRRAAERGRMLPPGLTYIDSWVVDDDALDRCFQLMETDRAALFDTGSRPGAIWPRSRSIRSSTRRRPPHAWTSAGARAAEARPATASSRRTAAPSPRDSSPAARW